MDEPLFLAVARQVNRDPLHPLSCVFNWYGRASPMAEINNTPPLPHYLLALALRLSGGGEFLTRALFFPFALAAGWGLLALAARFLKKPLWPTLIVLAGPGWALNMPHVMPEGVMAGFALPALWLAAVAADDGDARAFWGSAALAALALLTKYNALFLLPPVLVYLRSRGTAWRRLAAWAAAVLSGVGLYQLRSWIAGGAAVRAAATVLSQSAVMRTSAPTHKARALLAFTGGLGLVVAAWGTRLSPSRRALLWTGGACALLFGPWFDLAPLVRPVDRLTGFLLAWGTCVTAWTLLSGPRTRGTALWVPWIAAVAVLQWAYWAIVARFVVFLVPPLVFWLWERLEAERPSELAPLGRAGFGAALAFTLALGAVDWTYAAAQKSAAARTLARGRPVWCASHWGLQEYLVAGGARQLDWTAGGWDEVRPGDSVVLARANSNPLKPERPVLADVSVLRVDSPIPLRLISGWTGEGGFYSSMTGFLPWSLSAEPVDEITTVDVR